jgi:hypothetical protein
MILHRFMKHVGSQNWFAVGLDVLVVTLHVCMTIGTGQPEWLHLEPQGGQTAITD